jgi:hypothetical protein
MEGDRFEIRGMRLAVWLLVMAGSSSAAAGVPMTLLLASAHGRGSVAIRAGTAHLHGRVWLYRDGGIGDANGIANISCRTKKTAAGVGGLDESFRVKIGPSSRQLLWRYGGDACTISVSLKGRGQLRIALRGY